MGEAGQKIDRKGWAILEPTDLETGQYEFATVDQIDKLTERDDVMSVALVQQPRTSRKN
jgi:hypothetical protein